MDYNAIIKNYSEEKKENIVSLSKLNKHKMHNENTYHPAALLRNSNFKKPAWDDFQWIRDQLIKYQ